MADNPTPKPPKKKPGKKKGAPKTGGRQKGTRNRNSMSVLGALDKANIPLIELLVADIQFLEPQQRIDAWYRLLAFCYPKLKDIDPSPQLPLLTPPPSQLAGSPPVPPTKEERFSFIRGQVSSKSEAPD